MDWGGAAFGQGGAAPRVPPPPRLASGAGGRTVSGRALCSQAMPAARHAVALLSLGMLSSPADAQSFRNDGRAVYDAAPPTSWSTERNVCWRSAAPDWSNATPVHVGGMVCALAEPTTLFCLDAATGALRWQAEHPVDQAVPESERTRVREEQARALAAQERLQELQRAYSQARRDLRAGKEDGGAGLAALTAEMDALAPVMASGEHLVTPPVREVIGYSSHSPATDGERIVAMFGNGVVAARGLDGALLWATWLGPNPEPRRGYHMGTSASPLIVDGLVIAPYDHLRALDLATGREVWKAEPLYAEYGTPAVVRVGGVPYVATPSGELIRARDGRVVAMGLGDTWMVGPHVDGDVVYWAGKVVPEVATSHISHFAVQAWRVKPAGDAITTERLWVTRLDVDQPSYAAPVSFGHRLYVADATGNLWTLDRATGALMHRASLRLGVVYGSPVVAGGHLYLQGEELGAAVLGLDPEPTLVATSVLGSARATPLPVGNRLYVRTLDDVWCLEAE